MNLMRAQLFIVCLGLSAFAIFACNAGADASVDTESDRSANSTSSEDSVGDAGADGTSDGGVLDTADTAWPDRKYLSIEEVYALVTAHNEEMLLVNVSDEEFYNLGHIEGSLKIPWDTLADNLDAVDSVRYIVLYCRRGVRSESAYDVLVAASYPAVWVMQGGIEAWIEAGYPTVAE